MKKRILAAFTFIISLIAFYLFNRGACLYQRIPGDLLVKLNATIDSFFTSSITKPSNVATDKVSIIAGFIGAALIWLIYLYNVFGAKKYMFGIEHGSAGWGDSADIKPYMDKQNPDQNILLTATEGLNIDTRKTQRNNNVLVIGGSGSGKTRFYVKPNLMQLHTSYVITDPKGEILKSSGKLLADNGYKIKVFNLINMQESNKYNPFDYIRDEKDILKLINNLITNTTSPQARTGEDFWLKAEINVLQALFSYVHFEGFPEERNIGTVMEMIRLAEVREEDEMYKSPLDILFEDLEVENPNHFACKQYKIFKLSAGKTAKSILISLGVRLSAFYIEELADLLSQDELELDMIGSEKTALFIILPDSDKTFNFVAAIMYQQLFDVLFYEADNVYNGRLPYHVRFLLDEFPNIGQIPQFETYIATMRSREVSANIILQNMTQLKSIYKDTWETIIGNCDSLLFLGGNEQSTLEYLSKRCGKTTIDQRNINESRGQTGSYSMNHQVMGRDLITPDEIGRLPTDQCLLFLRGEKPFKSRKVNLLQHPRYPHLAENDSPTAFSFQDIKNQQPVFSFENVKVLMDAGVIDCT